MKSSGGSTFRLKEEIFTSPALSVTVTTTGKVPSVLGVPENTPFVKDTLGGSCPVNVIV
ncbi:hypothetical protein D3C87_2196200 [compost metagenome]